MSVRERMHQLIDDSPEDRLKSLEMMVAPAMAEYDDEPLDPDDEQTFEADWEEYTQGKTMSAEDAKELYL